MSEPRGSGHFNKPPLTSAELVDLLVRRGLEVPDRRAAEHALFHIGYYRLAPYLRPFERPGAGHLVRPGTSFADVLGVYAFDRDLRRLVADGLARIEVAYRAALSEVMSKIDADSHWYTKPHYFSSTNDYKVLQGNVAQALEQPFPALQDYLRRYRTPELPPSWLMVEVLSMGQLTRVYRSLKQPTHRRAVARAFGLSDEALASWLEAFVRIRNICAHHERLWDVPLERRPLVPANDAVAWPENWHKLLDETDRTLYCAVAAMQSMLFTIAPGSPWAQRLAGLLEGRAEVLGPMGFPEDWTLEPFWARALAEADPDAF